MIVQQKPPLSTNNHCNDMTTTTTTTIKDDIMTLSSFAAIINETLPHNPELQLSIHDLVHPTESAETLLETLSNEQLNIIEQAVNKIKERKLGNISNIAANENHQAVQSLSNITDDNTAQGVWNSNLVAVAISNQEILNITQPLPQAESAELSTQSMAITNKTSKDKPPIPPPQRNDANPYANSFTKATAAKPPVTSTAPSTSPFLSNHEPTTELKEGIEWVSFVYSHHRTLRRYCIRTDLDKVDTNILDDKFKNENCVYPRANLPRETYRGNRWSYETECNVLGWKLAYLNLEEIAGKRGLIQRAVDSYRNRYPSMRSRRVARQEKLLKGTLRKRKHRETTASTEDEDQSNKAAKTQHEYNEKAPKTILIEDSPLTSKCRIRINIESIVLDAIDIAFRKNNCVFPRAMHITSETPCVSQRRLDEAKCNEIGWKLAWLNPRQLANKKNLLQKALDTYRNQFTPNLRPRKYATRTAPALYVPPPSPPPPPTETSPPPPATAQNMEIIKQEVVVKQEVDANVTVDNARQTIPLTAQALAEQQKELFELGLANNTQHTRRDSTTDQSCYSGTTVTLDFHDFCFSPPPEEENDMMASCEEDTTTTTTMHDVSTAADSPIFPTTNNIFEDFILASFPPVNPNKDILMPDHLINNNNNNSGSNSSDESNGSSYQNTPSPQALLTLSELYQQAFLLGATHDGTQDGLFDPENNHNKENGLFMLDDENSTHVGSSVIDLIAKYGNVNAGVDGFTNTSSSVADPTLLHQLF